MYVHNEIILFSRFGTTYVGSKMLSPMEPATVLMGDVDPSGNMTANIVHSPLERLRCKMIAQGRNSMLSQQYVPTGPVDCVGYFLLTAILPKDTSIFAAVQVELARRWNNQMKLNIKM